MVQQWMGMEEANAHGEPLQEQTWLLHPAEFATHRNPCGAVPEGWVLQYAAMLEKCMKSCKLWEAHIGSVQEERHPMGGTASHGRDLWRTGTESAHKAVIKHYGLTTASIALCHSGKEVEEGSLQVRGGRSSGFAFSSHCASLLSVDNKL